MSDLKQRLIDMANDFKSRAMFNNEANALKALERIEALEARLKPFAELKPVAWSLDADMFYIATNDIRHAASLLEKKP